MDRAQRATAQQPSLEVIVANPDAPVNRSDALLHDADKKPNLSGHNSPRRGLGAQIAQSVRAEVEGWSFGQHLRTNHELAAEHEGGGDTAIIQILNYHLYRPDSAMNRDFYNGRHDTPEVRAELQALKERRNMILMLQGAEHLHNRTEDAKYQHSQKGYANGIGNLSREERRKIGRRIHEKQTHKPSFGGLRFGSAEEFAVSQVFKFFVPGFSIVEGETYQINMSAPEDVAVGESKRIDFYVSANDLAAFVEWHPIVLANPDNYRSGFTSQAQFEKYQRGRRRIASHLKSFDDNWKARLASNYERKRQALVNASPFEGTPVIVAYKPSHLSRVFTTLDMTPPHPAELLQAFTKFATDYKRGRHYVTKHYSL